MRLTSKSLSISLLLISIVSITSCGDSDSPEQLGIVLFDQEMRDFVIGISKYAKASDPNFIVIPQNGQELITEFGNVENEVQMDYVDAIDATGREDMFYGYDNDDEQTPEDEKQYLLDFCLLFEQNGVEVLTTDYCSTPAKMDDSYAKNEANGFISFAADERDLNSIPAYPQTPYNENDDDITDISKARNFLYLINSENYNTKADFLGAVAETNYDAVIMDLFHNEEAFTAQELQQIRTKKNGGKRLLLCYMSIGEAEDYRYYWNESWQVGNPKFIAAENPDWEGNYKVRYWQEEWQQVIYGNENAYLDKILTAGFNGVYLDIIDAFEYFRENE